MYLKYVNQNKKDGPSDNYAGRAKRKQEIIQNNASKFNVSNQVSKKKEIKKSTIMDVNSKYIRNIIFSFLDEKAKLNLIKYNKYFQKSFSIDIEYYKIISRRYIVKDLNGYAKEYLLNTNELIFEGQYKNNNRNGEGTEYHDGKKIFKGQFLNGKRNGKGEEYESDYFNELIFKGEYLNGKRHGIGEEITWELIFKGNFLNGEKKKGKEYLKKYPFVDGTKLAFEGEYLNGKRWNGKKYKYYENGKLNYEIEYLNGKKWNGKGYDINNKLIYVLNNGKGNNIKKYYYEGKIKFEGKYLNGKKNGKGKEFYENDKSIIKFEGEYLNGKKWTGTGYDYNGKQVYTIKNGEGYIKYYYYGKIAQHFEFEGEFKNGEKNGKGKEYGYLERLTFEGEYLNGKKNGKGKIYDIKREEYYTCRESESTDYYEYEYLSFEGEFLNDKKNGKGTEYGYPKEKLYEGEYLNGLKNGKGKENTEDGNTYDGEFLNGVRNGKAKLYNYEGKLLFEGEYLNGEKWNGKIREYDKDKLIFQGVYFNGKLVKK